MGLASITNLMNSVLKDTELAQQNIMLVRQDGLVLFSNREKGIDRHSFGALVGGVWQAAKTLSDLVEADTNEIFKLNFGTSSKGIFLMPLEHGNDELYLSLIFKDEVNPGKLKFQLQTRREDIQDGLNQIKPQKEEQQEQERSGFLFKNITDEEIDQLFHGTRI